MTHTNIMTDKRFNLFDECKVFQIVVRVGGGNFTGNRQGGGGGIFYLVKGTGGGGILTIRTFFKAKNSFL